jgi:predicted glutamine amidotransferase
MCRLLGVVASRRTALSELLAYELDHFLGMAREHSDGWGMAYTDPTDGLVLAKEPVRADFSSDFGPLVGCCITDAALLHLRLASPRSAAKDGNTHPFGDERIAFAHDGFFSPPDALDGLLGAARLVALEGDTDSERFYRAVRRRVDYGVEPARALIQAAEDIRAVADEYASLNCLLLTPSALFAYAEHDPSSEVFGRRGPDFFDLSYRVEPGKVVVGSTGWSQPAPHWRRLGQRQVLQIDRRDLRTTLHDA